MITIFLFTAKFSAKQGDHRVTVFLFTDEFFTKQGGDSRSQRCMHSLPLKIQPSEEMT